MPYTIDSLEYGTVVMHISELTGDTPDDAGYNPDAYDLQAVVTFVPDDIARVIHIPGANPPRTAYQADVGAVIDNGVLTLNDQAFVRLVASTSTSINPHNWFWTAKFSDASANGESIELPDIRFQLSAANDDANPLDLTLAASQTVVSPVTVTTQGPAGAPGAALKPMPPVATFSALPTSLGNNVTDINKFYIASDTGEGYVWTGTQFRDIGNLRGPSGGATGATGATPAIVVGTVTTLAPGASATVTKDAASTATNVILNFGIPQGAKGDPGNDALNSINDGTQGPDTTWSSDFINTKLDTLQGEIDNIPTGGGGGGTGGVNEDHLVSLRRANPDGTLPTNSAQQADTTLWWISTDFPADSNPALKDGALFSAIDGSS